MVCLLPRKVANSIGEKNQPKAMPTNPLVKRTNSEIWFLVNQWELLAPLAKINLFDWAGTSRPNLFLKQTMFAFIKQSHEQEKTHVVIIHVVIQ